MLIQRLLLITGLAVFANTQAGVPLDRIVAVVNDDVVMLSELENQLRTVKAQIAQARTQAPPDNILERQVLERLIINKLQLQFAANTGIQVDDETLNNTIANIAAENGVSLAQFRDILESDGYSYEMFRENIRNEITIARLKQRQIDNRITITEREINNYIENQESQQGQDEYRLSHILIALPEAPTVAETEQVRAKAEKVIQELEAGTDFQTLAIEVSNSQQALNGGDLGWRKAEEIPSLFTGLVRTMAKGEVSNIIESPSGFHIIELTDIRGEQRENIVTQTKARHILIKPNQLMTDADVRERLDQLRLRILAGEDFGDLARAHSEDTMSAVDGGELNWANPGDLVPKFEQEMENLDDGKISYPFRTRFGWHIIQVMERRQHDNSEDLQRTRAREAIRARKIEEAQQNWLRTLRDEAYVEYRLDEN
ncbi:MAG: molecular chaperone SurA [Gammaproteobacteria bacterium]|nr:molecular chaperone SurA [Gammaproteobacteria bacterium]NIN62445.1 molecular chaperone SurA [Gammaproteobacteria bacterium]NIO63040.1 molecular chaperone SurA [Gammaproteobacteria bacterium]NIP49013.1 molecular chaperone SurA [Gammaproteobacteria bacterium]NIQ09469.1 molecular chaperone SurA [Gammaproteobacteria bacterium]